MLPEEFRISFVVRPKHLLLSPLGVLLVIGLYHLPWGAQSAPAWVQAVGSIAAIIVAIWISNWQQRQASIERQRKNYRYMFMAFEVASNSTATIVSVAQDIAAGRLGQGHIAYYRAILTAAEKEVEGFRSLDMVDHEFARGWVDITWHVMLSKSRIDDNADNPELIPKSVNIPLLLEVVPARMKELQRLLQEHSRRVGPLVYQDLHL